MNQRIIGIILLVAGILLAGLVHSYKADAETHVNLVMQQSGTCFLDDGTCLHAELAGNKFLFGYVIAAALLILGVYLLVFDKSMQMLERHQQSIAASFNEATSRDAFEAFLRGFDKEEQAALRAINAQDGILQSTLRYKLDKSKAYVSELISSLEAKGAVSREKSGKTYKVYVRL